MYKYVITFICFIYYITHIYFSTYTINLPGGDRYDSLFTPQTPLFLP